MKPFTNIFTLRFTVMDTDTSNQNTKTCDHTLPVIENDE